MRWCTKIDKYQVHIYLNFCRTPTRSDHEVRLSRPPPAHHPRHLAQRLKAALPTGTRPQTHTFSESSCQQLFKNGNVTQIQRQRQLQIRRQKQRRRRQDNNWNTNSVLYFRNPDDTPSPAQHCPVQSRAALYSLVPPSTVQYFPVQSSAAQYSLVTCSNVFKLFQNFFKCVQTCSKLVQTRSNLFKTCSNVFKHV